MMKRFTATIMALIFTLSLVSCGKKKTDDSKETQTGVNVEVYTAKREDISSTVSYTGEIKAGSSVFVTSKVSAKTVSVNVKEGDYVKAGQLLAALDKTDLELTYKQAKASYNSALANLNMTKNSTAQRNTTQAEQNAATAQTNYESALTAYNRELALYEQNSTVTLAQQSYDDAVAAYERAKNLYDNDTNLISAKNAYQTAKDNYTRSESLYSQGAISKVELDNAKTSMENAQAALSSAENNNKASLDNAHSSVVNAEENLKKAKTTASASLDAARASLENAKNALDSANKNIKITANTNADSIKAAEASVQSAKASLDIAKNNLNNTSITAPIDGYISSRTINVGQMISPGAELFSIKNSNTVDAEIKVTESVIPYIYEGTNAIISVKSAGISDIFGSVTLVNPVKDERSGMYTVRVTIDNSTGELKVGMFADITLETNSESDAVVIPSEAVMQSGDELYVYIANGTKAEKRTVVTGIESNNSIQITDGIHAGEKVIVSGKDYLSETNNDIIIKKEN